MNRSQWHADISRRRFIKAAGKSVLGGALVTAAPALVEPLAMAEDAATKPGKALVGSNIYGWGQYYQRMKKDLNEHYDEVLSALRDSGYDYLETFMDTQTPENNAKTAERMKAKGLKPVSIYTGARLHENGKAEEVVERVLKAAQVCQQAGFSVLSCNPDPIGREKTDEELKIQTAALTQLGKGLAALGIQLGVHHHLPEMANKAREFHYVFEHSPAQLVGFCYDVHWIYRGGLPPQEVLPRYGERVVTWHLRQSRKGVWWENLDEGDIDYSAVARYARQHGLPARYTVELALENGTEVTRSVVENHRLSREFVRRVFES